MIIAPIATEQYVRKSALILNEACALAVDIKIFSCRIAGFIYCQNIFNVSLPFALILQGDTSGCAKPPVDFKIKVPGQAKTELLF